MSRLFYEQPQPKSNSFPRMGFEIDDDRSTAMRYLEKVAKLIPSEVLAGYVVLIGFVPLVQQKELQPWIYCVIVLICLTVTPVYLSMQAEKHKPKRVHLIVSTIAFLVWAYSISGDVVVPTLYDPALSSIILVCFSLIAGAIPLKH